MIKQQVYVNGIATMVSQKDLTKKVIGQNELGNDIYGDYYKNYNVDMTVDMVKEQTETEANLQATYTTAMEAMMDVKASERGYDTRYTASARAGVEGSPFQAEGQAFALWMDSCYAQGYKILADVKAGARTMPTVDEFLLELPKLVW